MAEGACCALGEGQDGQESLSLVGCGAGATEGCAPHHCLHSRVLPTTCEHLLALCPTLGAPSWAVPLGGWEVSISPTSQVPQLGSDMEL